MDTSFAQPHTPAADGIIKWDITPAEERWQIFKEAVFGFVLGTLVVGFASISYGFSETNATAKEIIASLVYSPIVPGVAVIVWVIFRLARSGAHRFYELSDAGVSMYTQKKSQKYLWSDFDSYSDPDEKYTSGNAGGNNSSLSGAFQAAQGAKSISRPLYYLRLKKRLWWLPVVKLVVITPEPEVEALVAASVEKHLPKRQLIGLQLYRIIY